MRRLQLCWQTLVWSSQDNPPRFMEVLMLLLAVSLLIVWIITGQGPYFILSLSYAIGSSSSVLVREHFVASPRLRPSQITAALLLVLSIYSFIEWYSL